MARDKDAAVEDMGTNLHPDPLAPSRPALRYHGAKWRLAPWILSHMPAHEVYVEPFGGSAAVLLRKSRSLIEVYNDLDGEVVNFFRVMRDCPGRLIEQIRWTPFAHAEWQLAFEPDGDPLEAARRFFIRSYMSIAGPTAQWGTGWRRQTTYSRGANGNNSMTPAAVSFAKVEHLYQVGERLRGVIIEEMPALEVIERYDGPEALFYLDPPYVPQTRSKWAGHAYREEMDEAGHAQLLERVHSIEGMALISGYRCTLYDEQLADWRRVDKTARVNGQSNAVESLWISPRAWARLRHTDLPLFS